MDADEPAEKLLAREFRQLALDWSRDGETLLYQELHPNTERDLWALPLATGEPRPVLQSAFRDWSVTLSPDGQWLAYVSDVSGPLELYVQRFPSSDKRW